MNRRSAPVAIVTGAASGIGAALCDLLACRGARVIGADVDPAGLDLLSAAGVLDRSVVVDVSDGAAVDELVEAARRDLGSLDLMFNNAGIVAGGRFADTDATSWQRVVDVNLWGVVHGMQSAYRVMAAQGHGHIVNTASTAGLVPVARSSAYTATKHAVVGLSAAVRHEALERGVRITVAVPGLVDTPIFTKAIDVGDHDYQRAVDRIPLGRLSPSQAATLILKGVDRNRATVIFPWSNRALVSAHRLWPSGVERLIARMM